MIAALLAVVAGCGMHLMVTALLFGWRGLWIGSPDVGPRPRRSLDDRARVWLTQTGFDSLRPRDLGLLVGALFALGSVVSFALFGGALPAVVAGVLVAAVPLATMRQRRRARRAAAHDAWPRMIEEIRILTGSVGRSIPQALFEAGRDGPVELRGAFEAAQREWLISTDFARTVAVLKGSLGDATADAALETLLIAQELGGRDLDRRLADLADERREDLQYRKDVRARQAGVRFARRFVLIVPFGMASAGLSVGNGRAAYETPTGQLTVVLALVMITVCWLWAGQLMRLPEADRVFSDR